MQGKHKMKHMVWIFALALCLCLHGSRVTAAETHAPAEQQSPQLAHLLTQPYCAVLDKVLGDIIGKRRLGYFADAIGADGNVHMWFVSSKRRDWVQIVVYEDLQACITAEGMSFGFALEPMKTPSPTAKALYPDIGLPVPEADSSP